MTVRDLALTALDTLPDDAVLDDLIERVIFLEKLNRRLERADSEPVYTHDEVKRRMTEWRS